MKSITPFFIIDYQCVEAFSFYKDVFNASVVEENYEENDVIGLNNEHLKGKLNNIWLQINDTINLRGCNRSSFFNQFEIHVPFNVMLIDADSKEELIDLHQNLSYNGKTVLSIRRTNWFTFFCMVFDQFGVYWIIVYDANKK
ncbi:VOC family protein [uncultured Winogradskyella sp.]|uniref:VOC family protein n=1 Tax=uncultured Winogradskyella sp. TaxID=395353 RepID=UPI002639B642|nr:VOC family protein [uncultured Winogradskyella sp.]